MTVYSTIINVQKNDLDELQHVNNIRYIEWIQQVSKDHWQARASDAQQKEFIWVVKAHRINYHSSAILGNEIAITTHILKSQGPISTRKVEMKDNKTGKLLVTSETDWCLLRPKTMRPARIPEEIHKLFEPS